MASKYQIKTTQEDKDRLSDEFERAWQQRREIARRKYEASRPPRRTYETAPLEEEPEAPKETP
jgi:hypothetical protein